MLRREKGFCPYTRRLGIRRAYAVNEVIVVAERILLFGPLFTGQTNVYSRFSVFDEGVK